MATRGAGRGAGGRGRGAPEFVPGATRGGGAAPLGAGNFALRHPLFRCAARWGRRLCGDAASRGGGAGGLGVRHSPERLRGRQKEKVVGTPGPATLELAGGIVAVSPLSAHENSPGSHCRPCGRATRLTPGRALPGAFCPGNNLPGLLSNSFPVPPRVPRLLPQPGFAPWAGSPLGVCSRVSRQSGARCFEMRS